MGIAKFRRGDGVEFETEEGSASFELMVKDGSFDRIVEQTEPDTKAVQAVDLSKLSKNS